MTSKPHVPAPIPDVIWDSQLDAALLEVIARAAGQCTTIQLIDALDTLSKDLADDDD